MPKQDNINRPPHRFLISNVNAERGKSFMLGMPLMGILRNCFRATARIYPTFVTLYCVQYSQPVKLIRKSLISKTR